MRRRPAGHYEPTLAYSLADQARSAGVELDAAPGPWRARLRRRGFELIAVVTNGRTEIVVGSTERAADVAGLLNWCGLNDLSPVSQLRPPVDSEPVPQEELRPAG